MFWAVMMSFCTTYVNEWQARYIHVLQMALADNSPEYASA